MVRSSEDGNCGAFLTGWYGNSPDDWGHTSNSRYERKYSENTSRAFFAACCEYVEYIEQGKAPGVLRREQLLRIQLIPTNAQRVFSWRFASGVASENDRLRLAMERHAGYVQRECVITVEMVTAVKKAATMRTSGGSALERVETLCSILEGHFFTHPERKSKFRATDSEGLPGSTAFISEALVAGITPLAYKDSVDVSSGVVED